MYYHSALKAGCLCLVFSFSVIATSAPAQSKSMTAAKIYEIREMCIKQAQAAYPDTGRTNEDVMGERTPIYQSCCKKNGIRP